jgi:hypothetical protein
MHNYVLWSYRTYLPKPKAWRKPIEFKRQVRLLHRGRKWLSMLQRANEGYLKPLEKVLMMAYGRTGKRRRELMQKVMAPEPPQTHDEVAALSFPKPYVKDWKPPAKVDALMRSQARQQEWLDRTSVKVRTKVKIPAENSWGKPMPQCRVTNMTHAWYVKQVDHLFPPLPESEWEELRSLATGETVCHGPAKRRTRTQSDSALDSNALLGNTLLEGPKKGRTFKDYVSGRPHDITPRLMRRLWAMIFRHVPIFLWNEDRERWTVQWGDAEKPPQLIAAPSSTRDALLFSTYESPSKFRAQFHRMPSGVYPLPTSSGLDG